MLLFMYCHYMAFLHCEMFARFSLGEPSAIYIYMWACERGRVGGVGGRKHVLCSGMLALVLLPA